MKQLNFQIACLLLSIALVPAVKADAGTEIELHSVNSGTYTIAVQFAPSVEAEFLLDTGASMVMMNEKLFKAITKHQKTTSTGKVAANMASGRMKSIPTYEIPSLVLGNGCDVGPIEVAVIRGATRNLIGLNALGKLGRLTLDLQTATLSTTNCPSDTLIGEQLAAKH